MYINIYIYKHTYIYIHIYIYKQKHIYLCQYRIMYEYKKCVYIYSDIYILPSEQARQQRRVQRESGQRQRCLWRSLGRGWILLYIYIIKNKRIYIYHRYKNIYIYTYYIREYICPLPAAALEGEALGVCVLETRG